MFRFPSVKTIVIYGKIGSGKSVVSNYLINRGFTVILSDLIVAEIYQDPLIAPVINRLFFHHQAKMVDKQEVWHLLRGSMRGRFLAFLYPLVYEKIKEKIRNAKSSLVFVEIALAERLGLLEQFDASILVESPETQRLSRVHRTRGYSLVETNFFNQQQKNIGTSIPTYRLVNDGTLECLYRRLERIVDEISFLG